MVACGRGGGLRQRGESRFSGAGKVGEEWSTVCRPAGEGEDENGKPGAPSSPALLRGGGGGGGSGYFSCDALAPGVPVGFPSFEGIKETLQNPERRGGKGFFSWVLYKLWLPLPAAVLTCGLRPQAVSPSSRREPSFSPPNLEPIGHSPAFMP